MDDKKQKTLLVLLAVMGLGAGGYFVFLRDSGASADQRNTGEVLTRQKRSTTTSSGTSGRRATRASVKRKSSGPIGRAKRATTKAKKTERVKRGSGKRAVKKKKKKRSPSA